MILTDGDLDRVALGTVKTIDIEKFAPPESIEWVYLEKPHISCRTDAVGNEAFAVIRDAMKADKVVGISKLVVGRREKAVVLEPRDEGNREIQLCEPAPFLYFENGQMAVADGASVWLVIVTCEAMEATAHPPKMSLRRLVRFAEYYRDLAAAAIRRGEDINGKVWVTEATVLSLPPTCGLHTELISSGHRPPSGIPKGPADARHGA